MPAGHTSKREFAARYRLNIVRSWLLFTFKYRNVKRSGFTRVMRGTAFSNAYPVTLGNNVQFGPRCFVGTPASIGNNVLFSADVKLIGRRDHDYSTAGRTIWRGERIAPLPICVDDDVWIGDGTKILSGVKVGRGSIVAAGSVVVMDIPPCEIWGGNPAKYIKDRFPTPEEKEAHLMFLNNA